LSLEIFFIVLRFGKLFLDFKSEIDEQGTENQLYIIGVLIGEFLLC